MAARRLVVAALGACTLAQAKPPPPAPVLSFGFDAGCKCARAKPPPPAPVLSFGFDAGFGDNMVLQRAPAQAAVYGFLDFNASQRGATVMVTVTTTDGVPVYSVAAKLNATQQTFGPDWGIRPCPSCDAIAPPFNPWNTPLASWKALLPPTLAGGSYQVTASCDGCSVGPTTVNITNVTYGDVIYCTGQSNMWLPVIHTFSRNESAANITAGRYSNVRMMAGSSGNVVRAAWPPQYGGAGGTNPWMTAAQAAPPGCVDKQDCPLFQVGATCYYFAEGLAELGVTVPIGIIDTAIGGQRIEEFMWNRTVGVCSDRLGENVPWWDAQLWGQQVVPFVDMTIGGVLWYQGENSMGGTKGNSAANVGYGCEMRELIKGYRAMWSLLPNTTDPLVPFGVVSLPSSGSEGGPNMGAMRWAQTANWGTLPTPDLPNTFLAQAYDLDDEWGPAAGPCFTSWYCCAGKTYNSTACAGREGLCSPACAANADTASYMGGIHPRTKKPLGYRLARGAYNTMYGGTGSTTGPTLRSCAITGSGSSAALTVQFDTAAMRGDSLVLQPIYPSVPQRYLTAGGSLLFVQTNASLFCMEAQCVKNETSGQCARQGRGYVGETCPTWAGGDGTTVLPTGTYDSGWVQLNYTLAEGGGSSGAITVDLSPLGGATPTAVRYAWTELSCCNYSDPTLYVTHGCKEECPIMSSAGLPANPFQARIVDGACACIAPQVCN